MNKYQHLIFVLLFFFIGLIHPFGTAYVSADELDRSVLDSFKSSDGSTPSPNEKEQSTGNSEESIKTNQDNSLEGQSLFGMFLQLFLALLVIIFMIYALIRFIGKRSQTYQTHRTLQTIGGVHVASNRSIQLIRIGDRVLVVGVGETIQLLKEIDDEREVKKILADYENQEGHEHLSLMYKWFQTKVQKKNEKQPLNMNFKGLLERQLTDVKKSQKQAHAAIKEREQ